jgi:hypothetical protein
MEGRAAAIAAGEAEEMVWLLEHPPLYTAGVSSKPGDLLDPGRFPVHQTGRGAPFHEGRRCFVVDKTRRDPPCCGSAVFTKESLVRGRI